MYITPRVLVQQEFLQLPVYSEFPLPAFVVGPNYSLARYNFPLEKANTVPGTLNGAAVETGNNYVSNSETAYDFPNVAPGATVDHEYTKVFAENVEALYFPLADLADPGISDNDAELVEIREGVYDQNKVRFSNVTLKTGNGFSRSVYFSNRDVRAGDVIELTDSLSNVVRAEITKVEAETANINPALSSQVAVAIYSGNNNASVNGYTMQVAGADFIASEVVGKYVTVATVGSRQIIACPDSETLILDAVVASPVSNKSYNIGGTYSGKLNAAPTSSDYNNAVTYIPSSGSNTNITISNVSSAYVGYASKAITADTYVVTVTTPDTTDLNEVRFSVDSMQGAFLTKQEQALANAVEDGDITEAILFLDTANGNIVKLDFAGSTGIFKRGSAWTLSVTAGVVQITPTASGDFSGPRNMTYKLTVERGGAFYDGTNSSSCARVVITSSDVDTSSVVFPRLNTFFSVGTFGVTAKFEAGTNNGGLILGDTYFVPVIAEQRGAYTIVEFSENLLPVTLTVAETLKAKLYLPQKSIQIPALRDIVEGTTNWSQEGNIITTNPAVTTYDSQLLSGATPARLPVNSAKLFVEHRALLPTYTVSIESIKNIAGVQAILGPVHPDNPLAQGVYDALLNAQGQVVYFAGVNSDDLEGYSTAIKLAEKSDKIYGLVPLTFDREIQDMFVGHVNAYSTPEMGRWRVTWLSIPDNKTSVMFDLKDDGNPYTGTITDDPALSGNQYKLLTVEGASFLTSGVRPNDSIRLNFRLDPDGNVIFDEYFVDKVRTNTTLTLTRSLSSPVFTPVKIQVVRNYTKSERAGNIATLAGSYSNRRVRVVFPDTYKYNGITKYGYFAAAGLAGLRSGVVPHQGLTNTEFLGADDLSKVVLEFNQDDLDTMADKGVWLLTQEIVGATPYVRHQLTSDKSSLNTSEDSITTNVDNISYALKKTLSPFIGRYNVNAENVAVIRAAIVAELTFRASNTATARTGNQLTSFTPKDDILRIAQNDTYKDMIDAEVRLNIPYPLNYINLRVIAG
jgi:hypothetical protein